MRPTSPTRPCLRLTLRSRKIPTSSAGGTLLVSDVDTGESAFDPAFTGDVGDLGHGTFTFDAATGAWTYTLDDTDTAVQALGEGDPLTDTYTVQSVDGTSHTITVNITGTNDAAVITDAAVPVADFSVTEDTDPSAGGTLLVSDVDTGESRLRPVLYGRCGRQ